MGMMAERFGPPCDGGPASGSVGPEEAGDDPRGTPVVSGDGLVRGLLGAVLLAAGVLKGAALATGPVTGDGLLASRGFLVGLVEGELAFGLWLLAGLYPGTTRWVALGCFTTFGGVALSRALAGQASCGCFGPVGISPWATFAFDAAAVAALLRWRPTTAAPPTVRSHPARALGFLFAAALVGIPAAVAMGRSQPATLTAGGELPGAGELVILEPAAWVGSRFPLLPHIDIGDRLAVGRWTVVLYHHDCPSCREAIPAYERRARALRGRPGAPRIALIAMPPYAPPGAGLVAADSPCVPGRLDESREWFVTTPAEIVVEDAIVLPHPDGRPATP